MRNDENHAGSVELATGGSEVAIVQSPECQTVTIDQHGNNSPVTINQSANGGENVNCGVRPDDQPSPVAIEQSGEAHSMRSASETDEGFGAASAGEDGQPRERKERAKETRRRRTKGLGGLQLEKTGMWTLRCIINGKRVAKSTGTKDRAEAELFAKKFLAPYVKDDAARTYENIQAAVMTERQLAEMREAEGPQLKLADAWAAYEASPMRRDLAPTTMDGKKQVCRVFVDYMAKVFPEVTEVRHITRYHVEHYLDYLRRESAASTYNNRLCVLREVHRTIMAKAAAKVNPWEGFPLRADDSHTRRELTIEELARLVDMASREGPEWRTLFGIAMYTGLRLGDCCKLTWAEVDIVRSIIQKIPEKTKKYRKGRPVTIPIHK
ncbi:MAG: site-specific integrase, partial [Kiritimatiellae bacterium]|nr:site-specific integrase [Kiritimatiellia bacterium]